MDYTEMAKFLSYIGVSSASLTFIAIFLGRKLIDCLLKKDFEKFKQDFEMDRLTYQIKFGGIYEQQAKGVLDLYKKMLTFMEDAKIVYYVLDDTELDFFADSCGKLQKSYDENKIFLTPDVEKSFKVFYSNHHELIKIINQHTIDKKNSINAIRNAFKETEATIKMKALIKDLEATQEKLVNEFRNLIGIIDRK